MNKIKTFSVEEIGNNPRLDKFLAAKFNDITRTQIKKIIISRNLSINNKIVSSPSQKVRIGDKISFSISENKNEYIKPEKIKINIVYEDNDLIVLDKPSGIVVHPGAGNKSGTLVNGLVYHYNKNLSDLNGIYRPGIVHRIDKETSGLIVVAKNNFSHAKLAKQFSEHSIKRKYLALIWGILRPLKGKIITLISRSKKNRQLMAVSEISGKKAITNYKTLKVFTNDEIPKISLVECVLETGRTHQIRVHLSHKGNGLIGDKKYGKQKKMKFKRINKKVEEVLKTFNRQALHAQSLGFTHPSKNRQIEFGSKLPQDFKKILDILEKLTN